MGPSDLSDGLSPGSVSAGGSARSQEPPDRHGRVVLDGGIFEIGELSHLVDKWGSAPAEC